MSLRWFDGRDWRTRSTATTDADGRYAFPAVPALLAGEAYYVRFGPNTTDATKLWSWAGRSIETYSAGTDAAGADFDVAGVPLVSPAHGATVGLPATFAWLPRGIAGDQFRWWIEETDGDRYWYSDDFVTGDRFTLPDLPLGMVAGRAYRWFVRVYNGPNGYGMSFSSEVIFGP